MNLFVNEVFQEVSTTKNYRILWIDPGYIIVYIIDLDNKSAFPEKKLVSELIEAIILGEWIKLKDHNFTFVMSKEYEEKHFAARDLAWSVIKELVVSEPQIFEKAYRTKLIKQTCKEQNVTYPTVRKYLYRYWSRGKNVDALLPDYKNSGAVGKERKAGIKKRGRPSYSGIKGINIDEQTKKIFRLAIEKYYLTQKGNSLVDVYNFMLKDFYAEDIYYENGVEKVILKNENEIPNLDQFRYWFKKEYNAPQILKARKGDKRYNKDHRAVLGTSLSEVFGPGSRYQIDATIGDVYLVSEINRSWIIGRPVIYIVIDVFSRMVVGMYVGLEGPSWTGAMMALANVVTDKKVYCANYDIEIDEKDWPSNHLPEILLADKGEFEGYNVDRLITAFNLHVENAASYRADWKGIVEKQFDLIQKKVKPLLSGYIDKDFQERGAKDYRLDAKLTLKEFTQILIKQILQYNKKHYLKSYVRDKELVAAEVLPIPVDLWNWGIQNRTGKLRVFPEELVKLQLLPRAKATVTFKGIQFKGISYSCESALKEMWFENARMKGSWKVELAYDPRDISNVYVIDESIGFFEKCNMLDVSKRYFGLSLDEVIYWRQKENKLVKTLNHKQLQKEVDYISEVEEIVKKAENSTTEVKDFNISKSKKIGAIRDNRRLEKKYQQTKEAELFIRNETTDEKEINLPVKIENEEFQRQNIRDFLKRRKENENE
ncbi:Mu transposase C-terminal domain-containing protein [Priestia megaterium]|uniref:Mu transposase C-terminal domain-containing protein n=1 Tax=Priestia megaterium TaxID=1404 RepID=UPI003D080E64